MNNPFQKQTTERPRFLSFGMRAQIIFFKRLALYLETETPLLLALTFMCEDAENKSAAYILRTIRRHAEEGHSLANGLAPFPYIFSSFTQSVIKTGERAGHLPEALSQIAAMLAAREVLKQKVQSALIYPSIVVVATLAVSVFLTTYAFPKIIPLFRGFNATLPLPTRILIAVSDFFVHFGLFVALALVGVALLWFFLRAHPRIRHCTEYISLRFPVIGELIRAHHLASIARTLATLLQGGAPLVESIELTARATSRVDFQGALLSAYERVRRGTSFANALAEHSTLFPQVWKHLLATGEATGTLAVNLRTLSEFSEQELDEKSRLLTILIEPLLMIFMGLMVGFIALAIITPLYHITQDIQTH